MHHSYPDGILVSDVGSQRREPVLHICGKRVEGMKHLESIHSHTLAPEAGLAKASGAAFS
jgi:hypothetical protein